MNVPSKQVIDGVIADFIDHTSNSAMATGVCAACAQETDHKDLTQYPFDHNPNPHRLRPSLTHPAHDIYDGMLLQPAGIMAPELANLCFDCGKALNSDKIPSFSLANGMWIGATPHEFKYLTLPERLLIAKYFPATYIIKLYPKKKGARYWDRRQMYSGLKGNVSTYQLDQGQIASMIDGSIMPQQPKLLAATMGITFVGPKNVPDRCLLDIFRVRRTRVQKALEWLKENNPLFSNITISASRLAELPEDDVPYELQVTTKLLTDVDKLYAEHEGYVPVQDGCDEEAREGVFCFLCESSISSMILDSDMSESEETDIEMETTPTDPAVLMLSPLGVVDIDGVDVTDSELMAHALANCCQMVQEEDYMIRRGSAFVNEYARVDPLTGQRHDGGPADANHLRNIPNPFPLWTKRVRDRTACDGAVRKPRSMGVTI